MTEVNQMFGREDFRIAREAHYKRFLGEIDSVAHSMSVDLLPVHVDVYQLPPTGDRPYCSASLPSRSCPPATASPMLCSFVSADLRPLAMVTVLVADASA
jgi:hypothetical protein